MTQQQVLKGFLANPKIVPPLVFVFQFNPASISDKKAVNYADANGSGPGKEYTGGGHRTISFSFELHGLEQGTNTLNPSGVDNGITTELAKLRSFLYPKSDVWAVLGDSKDGEKVISPPTCYFGFGTRVLECQVTSLTIKETQFNSYLAPVRAEINIELTVTETPGNALYELDKQRRNLFAALGVQSISIP